MPAGPRRRPDEPQDRPRSKFASALLQDFNLIALAGVAALAALTGSPIPLIAGAAAEALYLINAPGSKWFDRYLAVQRARRRGLRRAAWRRDMVERLPRSERERFRGTQRRLAMAKDALDAETRALAQAELDRVEDLLNEMVELMAVRAAAGNYLASIDRKALERELRAVSRRAQEVRGDDMLVRVSTQRLAVLDRRMAELDEMERNLEIIGSQIATLEHSIGYLADKLQSWSAAGHEPQGLREILAGVESTERAIQEVRPVLDRIERARQS